MMYEEYRARVLGTTIDPNTFLSTDYFNLFNEVIMLFGMLPDMPDMLEEIDIWEFRTYQRHFELSGLGFADLAIEVYALAPDDLRNQLETLVDMMRMTVEMAREELRELVEKQSDDVMAEKAVGYSLELQRMVDQGSAIVHGSVGSLDQSAIDDMF